jgi:hypothetical protein
MYVTESDIPSIPQRISGKFLRIKDEQDAHLLLAESLVSNLDELSAAELPKARFTPCCGAPIGFKLSHDNY